MAYSKYYPGGWQNDQAGATPIIAAALNNMETGITNAVDGTLFDAKGDLIAASAADTPAKVTVGANDTVLVADSAQSAGIKWIQIGNAQIASAAAIDQTKIAFTATQTYVPAWTSSGTAPSLGNGTLTGRYIQIGKLVYFRTTLTMGSTTTFGTGAYFLSLPVTAQSASPGYDLGVAHARDSSAASDYVGATIISTTTTVAIETYASPTANWTNLVPFTWASADTLVINGCYEAA